MTKTKLFWTGITFQEIQLFGLIIILLGSINWGFLNLKFLFIGFWLMMNIISIILIFYGAVSEEETIIKGRNYKT
jgi:hypothetical protein